MISWPNGMPPTPERHHDDAEHDTAAENAPVDRPPFHGLGAAQEHAGDRDRR